MKSATFDRGQYQAILEEAREEAPRILLAWGTKRFGKPSAKHRKAVAAISELAAFEGLATRSLDVDSWTELLAELCCNPKRIH